MAEHRAAELPGLRLDRLEQPLAARSRDERTETVREDGQCGWRRAPAPGSQSAMVKLEIDVAERAEVTSRLQGFPLLKARVADELIQRVPGAPTRRDQRIENQVQVRLEPAVNLASARRASS